MRFLSVSRAEQPDCTHQLSYYYYSVILSFNTTENSCACPFRGRQLWYSSSEVLQKHWWSATSQPQFQSRVTFLLLSLHGSTTLAQHSSGGG